jgi:hypothetical protein
MDENMEKMYSDLERRVTLLENYVNLLSMKVVKTDIPQKKPPFKKYVVTTDSEEGIASIVFALNDICKINTNDRPNVTYVKVDGIDNLEIVVITKSFFYEWKKTHYKFYSCTYEGLLHNLRKDGVIDAEG